MHKDFKALRVGKVIFVKCDDVHVRVTAKGECDVSPVLFEVVEWDMRSESPDSWEYLSEAEIMAMDGGIYEKIMKVVSDVKKILGYDN